MARMATDDGMLPAALRDTAYNDAAQSSSGDAVPITLSSSELTSLLGEVPTLSGQSPYLTAVASDADQALVLDYYDSPALGQTLVASFVPTPGGTGGLTKQNAVIYNGLESADGTSYTMSWQGPDGATGSATTAMANVQTCGVGTGGAKCSYVAAAGAIVAGLLCPETFGLGCVFASAGAGLLADGACSGACPSRNVVTIGHSCTALSCTATAMSVGNGFFATQVRFLFFFTAPDGADWGWFVYGDQYSATALEQDWRATATPSYSNTCSFGAFDLWYEAKWSDGGSNLIETGGTYKKPTSC